jgi:hypothetical protein
MNRVMSGPVGGLVGSSFLNAFVTESGGVSGSAAIRR